MLPILSFLTAGNHFHNLLWYGPSNRPHSSDIPVVCGLDLHLSHEQKRLTRELEKQKKEKSTLSGVITGASV